MLSFFIYRWCLDFAQFLSGKSLAWSLVWVSGITILFMVFCLWARFLQMFASTAFTTAIALTLRGLPHIWRLFTKLSSRYCSRYRFLIISNYCPKNLKKGQNPCKKTFVNFAVKFKRSARKVQQESVHQLMADLKKNVIKVNFIFFVYENFKRSTILIKNKTILNFTNFFY